MHIDFGHSRQIPLFSFLGWEGGALSLLPVGASLEVPRFVRWVGRFVEVLVTTADPTAPENRGLKVI